MPRPKQVSVVRLRVEKLFGHLSYCLPPKDSTADLSKLFIVYGDNGSGKTTLLKMLYHVVATESDKGHKTTLANTKFKLFEVSLSDGTLIALQRGDSGVIGGFTLSIQRPRRKPKIAVVDAPYDGERYVVSGNKQRKAYSEVLASIRDVGIRIYYLSEDRRMNGGFLFAPIDIEGGSLPEEYRDRWLAQSRGGKQKGEELNLVFSLNAAVDRVSSWFNSKIINASSLGQESVHSVYSSVVNQFVEAVAGAVDQHTVEELVTRITYLSKRSNDYAVYGIASAIPSGDIVKSLKQSHGQARALLCSILTPYIDGIEARLRALGAVYDLLTMFLSRLEFFFQSKAVAYHVSGGLSIASKATGERLLPIMLSSGEKQLLLLMCIVLMARDSSTLFIIDEPEISLNVKWQRELIRSLVDLTGDGQIQFVIATHSIEMLANHTANLVRLEPSGPPTS